MRGKDGGCYHGCTVAGQYYSLKLDICLCLCKTKNAYQYSSYVLVPIQPGTIGNPRYQPVLGGVPGGGRRVVGYQVPVGGGTW